MAWKKVAMLVSVFAATATAANVKKLPHVRVEYSGIDDKQAESLAQTLEAAYKIYTDNGFDVPKSVALSVEVDPDKEAKLWTDGDDHITLVLRAKNGLARPSESGVFNLYGMCHELGHDVMYRVMAERGWLSSAAAEGWAHFAGSYVVDRVWEAKGETLWYDPYDYRADGTARLARSLKSKLPSKIDRMAGQWQKLEAIVGFKNITKLFAAWQKAEVKPADPEPALQAALLATYPDKKEPLTGWWKETAPLLVEKLPASKAKAVTISASKLTGKPTLVKMDDDAMDGKKSVSGGGHARKFTTPQGGPWYIRAVYIYGSRYGTPAPPRENFDLALCDKEMAGIVAWKKPYGTFQRGDMKWVRIDVPPTQVPTEFYVCIAFNPTATKGVFVGYDNSTHGGSRDTTPGKMGVVFKEGDWMIRVDLDQAKPGAEPTTQAE